MDVVNGVLVGTTEEADFYLMKKVKLTYRTDDYQSFLYSPKHYLGETWITEPDNCECWLHKLLYNFGLTKRMVATKSTVIAVTDNYIDIKVTSDF